MKYLRPAALILLLFSSSLLPLMAGAVLQDSIKGELTFIPVVNITGEITSTNAEILQIRGQLLSEENRRSILKGTDTLLFRLKLLREDPRIQEIDNLSFRSLSKLESEWTVLKSRLQVKESELQQVLIGLQGNITRLANMERIWMLTLANAREEMASDQLIKQVESTIDSLNLEQYHFREDSDFIQDRMVQVSNSLIFCNKLISEIGVANDITGNHILKMTQPPVWKALEIMRNDTVILTADRSMTNDIMFEIREFASDESLRIILHLFVFILLLIIITSSFKNLKTSIAVTGEAEAATISTIIGRPFSATLLLTFLASYFLYSTLPNSVGFLNLIILFLPVMSIMYDILPVKIRKYIILPSIAVMLAYAHSFGFSDSLFSRLFLISIDLFSIVSVIFAIRKRTFRDNAPNRRIGMMLYYLALTGILLMFIALVGGIAGAVRLSEFITYATLKSVALVFIIYAINKTLNSLLFTLIYGKISVNLKILTQYREIIYNRLSWAITTVSWIIWAILALTQFALWKGVYSIISGIFGYSIKIGTTHFTLASVIVFILVIWITIWLSRITKIIIEGEIAPRVRMKRGVPGAVTLILRIAIITAGFLFAVAAAGVEMDKLTILLGALGVGIGFGLQNIFNNLVSGIILAFERPIQEGDIIEVGELWGTVKEIGIRASVIFTFDGAEVIVPNGNLISNELINWTLSNQLRRVEATVGVKYGTEPDRVLEILRRVAESEPEVLKEPSPLALFSGFGDSSLDFRLLFWIDNAERRHIVHSKVNVAINRLIAEAGIEIPFPQRDLHLRSVDRNITDQYLK